MRKKSSDEVYVTIEDSNPSKKRYWNLRGSIDPNRKEYRYRDSSRETSHHHHRNGIHIDFDMDETRDITEEQKETILQTLIGKDPKREEPEPSSGRFWPDRNIPLIALLAFLSVIVLLIVVAASNSCYY